MIRNDARLVMRAGKQLAAMSMAIGTALAFGAGCDSTKIAAGAGGHAGAAGGAGGSPGAVSLYEKYGGAATVAKVVDDAVTGLLADCTEAPYFAGVGTPGHDSVARLKSCLRLQFTVLLGGPGVYPGLNDAGDMCASMTDIHAGLGITSDVFDKFVADLGAVLAADGVSAADVTTVAGALGPVKTQVVQEPAITYNACGGAGGTSGAGGAGGATTLYAKYGGAATVAKVVDDAVTGLLADCEEAPYFSAVGTTGHVSVARLKSCLRLQFTVLMGGPGTYPGVNDQGDTCASMTAIHAGLGITSSVFDKFVADLGAVLAADGVSAADVTTIASAVTPLKAQVVQAPAKTYNACGGAGGAGGTSGAGGAGGRAQ